MKYYALAKDKNGDIQVIANFPENLSRIEVKNSAIEFCSKSDLQFQELKAVKSAENRGDILTKTIKDKIGREINW